MSSNLHRVEPILTDFCRECGTAIQYASIDRAPYAWVHVLTFGHPHDPLPEHLSLRTITQRYEAERGL